ncbi:penicillin-binding transpeptidase domain-containing protein [Companilactobacillus nantensis]|uniref:Cell division protein FtsI penicillin-binding protein 2 n=1 Tax=Companilactobacillus nantensis DSM 16982 TaxID=1423774 RepID=A0A0R1WKD4_9LACO|nr:penicillin-binding transpeptidase domain-containing protein [Companilactobacillus nantensis]KRM18161.1 cell division protein FtsI penicillin-binding protein 2 [Companilactobacillus nantensis DSM 16982]GEO62821.1 cell division protein FtsI [Companilactobacillus nantensis]
MSKFRKLFKNKARRNHYIVGMVILIATAFSFILFIQRFAYISMSKQYDGVNLEQRTKQKYEHVNKVNAKRGDILDVNGDMIAGDSTIYNIYAIVSKKSKTTDGKADYVVDREKTARILSKYLPLSAKQLRQYLSPKNKDQYQVEFGPSGRGLSIEIKRKIAAKKLPGIHFVELPSRSYPNGVFATNLVGFTQANNANDQNSNISGVMGIEKYFNKILAGRDGKKITKVDNSGNELPDSQVIEKSSADGSNVYLTLNSKIQQYTEILAQSIDEKYEPKDLQILVMNAKTGAIEAATQRPTFNPTTGKGLDTSWRDTLVEDQFEPGSVMKILTLSASIDSGNYNPDELYKSGTVEVGGRTIGDWNTAGWGYIPLSEAFTRSSNVGMVKLEEQMGPKTWMQYMKKFHIGDKTGIELPGEVAGSISYEHLSDQAMTSFGQSVNVNTIQMLQAFSAIANGGKMIKPQIIKKVVDPNTGKTTKTYKRKVVGQPIKASTAKEVQKAMREVVTKNYGTGMVYNVPGVKVGVKTGTAQIASPAGGYLTGSNNYIFSVAGMIPYNNPNYIVYVTMRQPQKMTEAPEKILSEVFNPLVKRLVNQGKSPTKATEAGSQYVSIPSLLDKSTNDSLTKIKDLNLQSGVIGTGNKVVQQLPASGEKVMPDQRIVLLTNGAMTMPDLTGWSKNDVLKFAEITGKQVTTKGDGYVVKQSVKSGQVINGSGKIIVTLKNK